MKVLAIVGGAGRMGQALARGLSARDDFNVAALVDAHEPGALFGAAFFARVDDLDASRIDVVIDFSSPEGVASSAKWCAANGVALVVGTTGLSDEHRGALEAASQRVGVVVAANFAIGAVLSERFAAMAAPYFERVEIIELHHDSKVDAPSGTSIATAETVARARKAKGLGALLDSTKSHTFEGARGADVVDGVKVHSVRLPGLVAHQEILFGSRGEGLTIRHDSYDRESFLPGVAIAVSHVDAAKPGLLLGIDSLL
ncbi:MAG TPA: 4-hydroxy-tetrahydrodipicolinate reductase [Acidimicrobiales bacterium]|nr:4-hydroxy-tetrahydrodipicolinate reductase [Acidimicrobiales bacterium]